MCISVMYQCTSYFDLFYLLCRGHIKQTITMEISDESPTIVVPSANAQLLRQELQKLNLWDNTHKLKMLQNGYVAIPIKAVGDNLSVIKKYWPGYSIAYFNLPSSKKVTSKRNSPSAKLMYYVKELLNQYELSEGLLNEVPTKWERHGDLVIIPQSSFLSSEWQTIGLEKLWLVAANSLCCRRLARHSAVSNDGFRRSQVILLLGEDAVVSHTDNGIRYSYDVTKCMFSAGNITEKLRVASMDCRGEIVVDLYAGIGYFTLPYLVHAKAEHVHACEWNPDAVLALQNSLIANGVSNRCTVHAGDNRQLKLDSLADRVNLGLIPSSEEGWPIAVQVLKKRGGIFHVHGNVTTHQKGNVQKESDFSCDRNHFKGENVNKETCGKIISMKLPHAHTVQKIDGTDESLKTPSHPTKEPTCQSSEEKCNTKIETNHLMLNCIGTGLGHSEKDFHITELTSKSDHSLLLYDSAEKEHKMDPNSRDLVCQNYFSKSGKDSVLLACKGWANYVCSKIKTFLEADKGGKWVVDEKHIELVKWYAPHVMHVVLDIECRPLN